MKKLLLLTTALVAAAAPAHAGPVVAAAAWVGGVMSGSAGLVAAIAMRTAVGLGMSAISQAWSKSKAQGPVTRVSFEAQMGDDLPLSFVVGEYATAGKRKYLESWGRNTRFITEVIEVSALPQGFMAMWVDDEPGRLVAGRRGYVSAGASAGDLSEISEGASVPVGALDVGQPLENRASPSARIWVKWVDGTQTAADPFLTWAFGSHPDYPWTAGMIGRGKSYAIVTTRYDKESLTSYPAWLFQPAPMPLYDLRFDSTNGGSGTQRWGDRTTWQPTRNPAVVAYNIARGMYYGTEWVYGGKNLPAWRLPSAEWIAAANACSINVPLAGGGTEPRYRCGLEISVDSEPASVLEEIGKAANMRFAEVGGRLKPIVDLPGAAVFSITDGDILITEGQSFAPFLPLAETFNAISATYPEPREKWASKDAPIYIDTAATADDGGRYLPTSMSYPAVPFAGQVQRLMRSQMRDYRRMRQHQFFLPPDAYALEPGIDLVSWTSDRNGYINKLFMVERLAKTPGMNVSINLREVDPGDYDWSSDFEQPVTITPPLNPVPFDQPIRGLVVTGEIVFDSAARARRSVIRVACSGDEVGVTHIQIERRIFGQSLVTVEPSYPFTAPYAWDLKDVIHGQMYEVRARLLSSFTPRSIWSDWYLVQVPVVGLSWDDLTGEVRDDVESLEDWAEGTGGFYRDVLDELGIVRDEVIEGDFHSFSERERIRADIRQVEVSLGDATASAIDALVVRVEETEDGMAAQSDAITLVEARTDRGTASGLMRVTAESTPAGVQTRIGLRAEATTSEATHSAAMYLEAKSDGTSQAGFVADRFFIANATVANSPRAVPFVVDNGVVYIGDARVRTLSIQDNAVIVPIPLQSTTTYSLTAGGQANVIDATITLDLPAFIFVSWTATAAFTADVQATDFWTAEARIAGVKVASQSGRVTPAGGFVVAGGSLQPAGPCRIVCYLNNMATNATLVHTASNAIVLAAKK